MTLLIVGRDIHKGGLSWSDAPLHTMDGVFIHDLVAESPDGTLRDWAEQYYLRHPCLGLIVYYPPLYAAIEAGVFGIAGVSVLAARITVALFVLAAVGVLYRLGWRLTGSVLGAAAAALLAVASPAGVAWSRQIMLEWPAVLCIAMAVLGYVRWLDKPTWRDGVLTAAACTAAYLTKQTAVFVLILIVLHACLSGRARQLLRRSLLVPMLGGIAIMAAYATLTAGTNRLAPLLILGPSPLEHLTKLQTWGWYLLPGRLASIVGWPMLAGGILAILAWLAGRFREQLGLAKTVTSDKATSQASSISDADDNKPDRLQSLPWLWLVLWWLISTVMFAKEERYLFFAVPAAALVVAILLTRLDRHLPARLGSALLVLLTVIQFGIGVRTPAHRLPDMKPTVAFLAKQPDADLVLIDAVRDGQFVFDVRTHADANDRIIPMRASKFLYSRAARSRYDYQGHIEKQADLLPWLDEMGIRYVVMEDRLPMTTDQSWDAPPRLMLRQAVTRPGLFEEVHRQPLAGDDPAWNDVNLVTYRYLQAKPRRTDSVTIRIPAMGRDVTIQLPTQSAPAPE